MPIYTKKGDRGETGLFNGKRIPKSDALIEAIGVVDELNATIGVTASEFKNQKAKVKNTSQNLKFLETIQSDLFAIGARLAGYESGVLDSSGQVLERRVKEMEEEIDMMWKKMPPLSNFILPSGPVHLARTVCRRAERAVVRAKAKFCWQYLNRLSDYLFCLARWVNFKNKKAETIWKL